MSVFIDIDEKEQVIELRAYLKGRGAEVSEENAPEGLVKDLKQVMEASTVLWKEEDIPDTEIESIINSVISLVLVVPSDQSESLITLLCEKLAKSEKEDKKASIRLKLLWNLFHGLDHHSSHRFVVYTAMVRLAGTCELLHTLVTDLNQVRQWVKEWDISTLKVQALYRTLHDACIECNQTEKATKVMIELLGTYTEENASQARDDAHRCIVTCLADPNTYLMDHLLTLKPVKFLEGELIHDLLTIFVSGKVGRYVEFYEHNKDFVNSLGLNHEANLSKMNLLTFMQIAEGKSEVDFDLILKELKIPENEVESFIIDVVRTKQVRCKMDQMARKVVIFSTTHRTFGKQQWQLLREQLVAWQGNLNQVLTQLTTVAAAGHR